MIHFLKANIFIQKNISVKRKKRNQETMATKNRTLTSMLSCEYKSSLLSVDSMNESAATLITQSENADGSQCSGMTVKMNILNMFYYFFLYEQFLDLFLYFLFLLFRCYRPNGFARSS